jgi:hypothetical protein
MTILELGKQFRPSTSVIYPPFKKGRYMEEYFYDYYINHIISSERVYIPIFWTNLQNHPGFSKQKHNYERLLKIAIDKLPPNTKYFTVVQHDDGPQLNMVCDVLVFGACTGTIPLPLLYEDIDNRLHNISHKADQSSKKYLASFIGSTTHPIRRMLCNYIKSTDIYMETQNTWSPIVPQHLSTLFIEKTLESKFCLAPRGYGRSSFRFFEAMLLHTVPVYFWDDIEWLPYKDILDYSMFSVSIQEKDIPRTYEILASISDETYRSMLEELQKVCRYFTLEGMCEYISSLTYS